MHAPGIWGILIVAVVVILLFGRGKISGVMGEVATGIKAFQKGMKDDEKPTERVTTTTAEVDAREVDRSKDA
jgi:sec-independent protein translocase protein TatA